MTPLEQAARAAQHAPSVFNTQPWSWRITGDSLELRADTARRIDSIDPEGRLLLISCGGAVHHARVALNALGWSAPVELLPSSDVLARIRIGEAVEPDPVAVRMASAIEHRHTDRRAFGDRVVTEQELSLLRGVVEREGAYLHVVSPEQIPVLAISAEIAGGAELGDAAYRKDLETWTNRPASAGDGVPQGTAVQNTLRRVPVRDVFPDDPSVPSAGAARDQGAAYVVLFGNGDETADLLRGGAAMSALLLLATADGLSTAPLSDAVEMEWPRHLLRQLLADVGEPYIVVRLGYPASSESLPASPRRDAHDVISAQ